MEDKFYRSKIKRKEGETLYVKNCLRALSSSLLISHTSGKLVKINVSLVQTKIKNVKTNVKESLNLSLKTAIYIVQDLEIGYMKETLVTTNLHIRQLKAIGTLF